MDIDRVGLALESALRDTTLKDAGNRFDDRDVEVADRLRTQHMGGMVDVFDADQPHEIRIGLVVVEGAGNERAERLFRRLAGEL